MIKNINLENDHGSIDGYYHLNTSENIYNYFSDHSVDTGLIELLKNEKEIFVIGLIRNLWVEEVQRGKGYGAELMIQMMSEIDQHADLVFLIADSLEENSFSISEWYESYGFQEILETSCGALMVSGNEDLIIKIESCIFTTQKPSF